MRFATVYDNKSLYPHLAPKWGFACLVSDGLLFDTGGDGRTLLSNMAQMGIDPAGIGTVALSHAHGDHTGGLAGLLATGVRPTVYVPRSFPARFKAGVRSLTALVEVHGPVEIRPGIHTTGEVGRRIVEQALAVETEEGLVVVTGCAHPGVVEMVRRARDAAGGRTPPRTGGAGGGKVYLVLGGFHLGGMSGRQVERIIADFRQLGVQRAAPCHCTGDRATRILAEKYGEDFIRVGVGCVITISRRTSCQLVQPSSGEERWNETHSATRGWTTFPGDGGRAHCGCGRGAGGWGCGYRTERAPVVCGGARCLHL